MQAKEIETGAAKLKYPFLHFDSLTVFFLSKRSLSLSGALTLQK